MGLAVAGTGNRGMFCQDDTVMTMTGQKKEQPKPFTPGLSKAAVRQHAYEMFRDKLPDHPLTLEDWVLAEKDLVNSMEAEEG
jgi:hypothetical protein